MFLIAHSRFRFTAHRESLRFRVSRGCEQGELHSHGFEEFEFGSVQEAAGEEFH